MWAAFLLVSGFLQAGGVVPGRSCEPGGRFVATTGSPEARAAALASAVALGLILGGHRQ